ncbi:hypothetical protein FIBSPDRAFT_146050 [Athelia psychrophila]|uniref:Uncharacterized protein n=1 Tax=Athelia psychrophila TaxID=1759441 RepID=A0A166T4L8_9AGAM|nr:hypothetical protein FIBSPDRAFT_146050 [Fibularhizoctonia sp. CBS 109695]
MSISRAPLSKIPTSYATCSIGAPAKLASIELSFPDLLTYANLLVRAESKGPPAAAHPNPVSERDYDTLCDATPLRGVYILQPFAQFEGWHEGTREREDAGASAGVDTDHIGVRDRYAINSSDAPASSDPDAESGKTTRPPAWHRAWVFVRPVNMDSVGLCLDAFQAAGAEGGAIAGRGGEGGDGGAC